MHVADLRRIFKLYAKGSGARASCAGLGKLQFSRMCRECGLVLGVPRRNGAAAAREARLSPENLVASSEEPTASSEELTASSEELTASSEELALARIGASARAARASSEKLETSSPELATTAPELATSPQEPAKLTQSEVDSLFSRCNDDQSPYDLPSIRAAEYADQQREAKIRAKIQVEPHTGLALIAAPRVLASSTPNLEPRPHPKLCPHPPPLSPPRPHLFQPSMLLTSSPPLARRSCLPSPTTCTRDYSRNMPSARP